MSSSLGGDEDQGAGPQPSCVTAGDVLVACPIDRSNTGNPRSLTDTFTHPLTCAWTGPCIAAYVLLSN